VFLLRILTLFGVQMCEEFANSCPLVAPSDPMFRHLFSPLLELVNLFLGWDWVTFFDATGRAQKYSHVDMAMALKAVEDKKRKGEIEELMRKLLAAMAQELALG
jgi:hypothetical protein